MTDQVNEVVNSAADWVAVLASFSVERSVEVVNFVVFVSKKNGFVSYQIVCFTYPL